MCFSAASSFITAGILAGAVAIRSSKSSSYYLLASTPLLFVLQQTTEGIVWLTHANSDNIFLHNSAAYIFLIFALTVWPIWLPSSLLILEKAKTRLKTLAILLFIGISISVVGLYNLAICHGEMTIISNNLQYGIGYPNSLLKNLYLFVYALATVLPFFISSLKLGKLFGLSLLVALIVTYFFMLKAFISVWCFFATALSLLIIFIIWENPSNNTCEAKP